MPGGPSSGFRDEAFADVLPDAVDPSGHLLANLSEMTGDQTADRVLDGGPLDVVADKPVRGQNIVCERQPRPAWPAGSRDKGRRRGHLRRHRL